MIGRVDMLQRLHHCLQRKISLYVALLPLTAGVVLVGARQLPQYGRKLSTGVYADKRNYYFLNTFMGFIPPFDEFPKYTYIVDAHSGRLISTPQR